MRLFVIDDYKARGVFHPKGVVLDVPPDVAAFFMADAPGCFSLKDPAETRSVSANTVSIETAAIAGSPADKMVRRGRTK